MRKNYHNITLTDEVESYVKQYMRDNNIGLSDTINVLVFRGIQNIIESKEVTSISNGMEKISSKLYYLKVLMEQLYSDFNIDEPSNPRESIGLKILKDRYENDGPQKAKLYKLLRKYYIKNLKMLLFH